MKVGFIGFGRMGVPISKRIGEKFDIVAVYNRTKSKIPEKFASLAKDEPYEVVNNSDITLMIVTDSSASEQILTNIVNNFKGGKRILVDMSTISHDQSVKNHEMSERSGISYMDSPVIGSVPAAENGILGSSCGGSEEIFNEIVPVLKTFTSRQIYAGRGGHGIALKLMNNLIMGANMTALSEGLSLSRKMGISDDAFFNAVSSGGAASKILDLKKDKLMNDDFTAQFLLAHQLKDLNYVTDLQENQGALSFVSSLVYNIYAKEMDQHAGDDMSAVLNFYEKKKND